MPIISNIGLPPKVMTGGGAAGTPGGDRGGDPLNFDNVLAGGLISFIYHIKVRVWVGSFDHFREAVHPMPRVLAFQPHFSHDD